MSKADTPPAKPQAAAINVDAMLARLPAMSDADLASLHANAVRLKDSGSAAQRAGAAALLPAIEEERAKRPPPARPKPPVRKAKAKAPPKEKSDEPSELE